MTGPPPAVAACRVAVRRDLQGWPAGALVLVACSGGPDSLALADAVAWEAPRMGLKAGAVVVDHGLQSGSAQVAARAAEQCRGLGLRPVEVVRVTVQDSGGGPEADARAARYGALTLAAGRHGAAAVLLGHTRDDQAEQVLLGLARGAGTRSLSGMPRARGLLRRPLLDVPREQTHGAAAASGLLPWSDPHNADPSFARVRARRVVAALEEALGPGVGAALARSAAQLRADADLLEDLAAEALAVLGAPPWAVTDLAELPGPVRSRVLRMAIVAAGAPAGAVSSRHTAAADALITHWHGQGPVHAPGAILVTRHAGRMLIASASPVE